MEEAGIKNVEELHIVRTQMAAQHQEALQMHLEVRTMHNAGFNPAMPLSEL